MNRISFFEQIPVRWFKDRRRMKEFLAALFQQEGFSVGYLHVIFCSDEQLLAINQQYLQHHDYTDIITFDLTDRSSMRKNGEKLPLEGEIYISIERILENAETFKVDKQHELHRILFHGCLHLCGYGDKKPAEKRRMTDMENLYLSRFIVPRGTQELKG